MKVGDVLCDLHCCNICNIADAVHMLRQGLPVKAKWESDIAAHRLHKKGVTKVISWICHETDRAYDLAMAMVGDGRMLTNKHLVVCDVAEWGVRAVASYDNHWLYIVKLEV